MYTNIYEVLNRFTSKEAESQPNLDEILAQLKIEEINYHRSKVICISRAILENANSGFQQAQLKSSLFRLEILLTA